MQTFFSLILYEYILYKSCLIFYFKRFYCLYFVPKPLKSWNGETYITFLAHMNFKVMSYSYNFHYNFIKISQVY